MFYISSTSYLKLSFVEFSKSYLNKITKEKSQGLIVPQYIEQINIFLKKNNELFTL